MSLTVFSEIPLLGAEYEDDQKVARIAFAGGGAQRSLGQARPYRRLLLPFKRSTTGRATIDAFFAAVSYLKTSFLFKHWADYARVGVSLGTSAASQTVFDLPTGNPYGGDYPIDDANVVLYDDGSPYSAGTVTVGTDARQITISVAMTTGSVVTIDYWFYRRYVLASPYRWRISSAGAGWYVAEISLEEVPA